MTLIRVQPDRTWLVSEVYLRMAVDASMPDELFPALLEKPILEQIERIERLRHWKFLEVVPRKGKDFVPCCDQLRAPAGSLISILIQDSPLQGDTDDLALGGLGDTYKRHAVQGKRDLRVVTHFLQPAVHLDAEAIAKETPQTKDGFLSPEELPTPLKKQLEGVMATSEVAEEDDNDSSSE